ncbi:MAG: sugar ABC transporter permease, partial [Acidobacteria bacterium]|nr:sugar ABC transporter permease [Acidobacteriota bacterium]
MAFSLRRRVLLSLALSGLLGGFVAQKALLVAERAEEENRAERLAMVGARGFADLVARIGSDGDAIRKGVAVWHGADSSLLWTRVILFDGLSLEASSKPEDTGERAAPRRLTREEKPVYDRGQRLRQAVEANRSEGGGKDEVEVERLGDGSYSLAAPVEREGEVVGLVEIATKPLPLHPAPPWAITLLYALAPALGLLVLSFLLGERAVPLVAAAVLLLLVSAWGFTDRAGARLSRERLASNAAIGQAARAEGLRLKEVTAELGLAAPEGAPAIAPGAWDADRQRKPLGLLTPAGDPDPAREASGLASLRGQVRKAGAGAAVFGLLALLFGALGFAERTFHALVRFRTAYSYVSPALVGMLVLVFFPFLYGVALSFTDSNIYNSQKPIADLWVGLKNYATILGDFAIARRAADGALVWNYQNFYWTMFITIVWTAANVTFGVTFGLLLALALN